jgi:DNA-binding response OmpR family regulator
MSGTRIIIDAVNSLESAAAVLCGIGGKPNHLRWCMAHERKMHKPEVSGFGRRRDGFKRGRQVPRRAHPRMALPGEAASPHTVWWWGRDARALDWVTQKRPARTLRVVPINSLAHAMGALHEPDLLVVAFPATLTRVARLDRLEALRRVVQYRPELPIITLDEALSGGGVFAGLHVHAHLTMPVDADVLLGCIEHAVRSTGRALQAAPVLRSDQGVLIYKGVELKLTRDQRCLLEVLWSNPFGTFDRVAIMERLFPNPLDPFVDEEARLDRAVRRLRQKLSPLFANVNEVLNSVSFDSLRWCYPVVALREKPYPSTVESTSGRGLAIWLTSALTQRPDLRNAITGLGFELLETRSASTVRRYADQLTFAMLDPHHPDARATAHWLIDRRPPVPILLIRTGPQASLAAAGVPWPVAPTAVLHDNIDEADLRAWIDWAAAAHTRHLTLPVQGSCPFYLDEVGRIAFAYGEPIAVPAQELRVLAALFRYVNRTLPFEQLRHMVWGRQPEKGNRAMYVRICRLRKAFSKLNHPMRPRIETIPGQGYRLVVEGYEAGG